MRVAVPSGLSVVRGGSNELIMIVDGKLTASASAAKRLVMDKTVNT